MNKPQLFKAKLLNKEKVSNTVWEYTFSADDLAFVPGQYLTIVIGPRERRQYSFSSQNLSNQNFQIIFDTRPNGVGTKYLLDLNIGDVIQGIGGIGNFILPKELAKNLVFIGTGTGVAPLKSMIEDLISNKKHLAHNIFLYFGTRNSEGIIYEDLFNSWCNKKFLKDFKIGLSRDTNNNYHQGYVNQFINEFDLSKSQFFLCGSGEMIKSVEEDLISKGAKQEQIFYEKFY